jgi:tetratricopeptide (TPR) repeat protein
MTKLFQTNLVLHPSFWVGMIVGTILVSIWPEERIGWIFLNIYLLFPLMDFLTTVFHELGHFLAARWLKGIRVIQVFIGAGEVFRQFLLFGVKWEIRYNYLLTGGANIFICYSERFYRFKIFLIIACGPLMNLLLILGLMQFPQKIILSPLPHTYLYLGTVFYVANLWTLLITLFPKHCTVDGRNLPSDGLAMLKIPFMGKQAIKEEIALAYTVNGLEQHAEKDYATALGSFERALRKNPNCVEAYYGRGLIHYALRQKDNDFLQTAIADCNEAIHLAPSNPDLNLG